MKRKNYLEQIISIQRGLTENRWHYTKLDTFKEKSLTINLSKLVYGNQQSDLLTHFENFDNQYTKIENYLNMKNVDFLELSYESHIQKDPLSAYTEVCRFLEVKPEAVKVNYRRSTNIPLNAEVSNYEDLISCLSNTPYEWMLNE